MCEPLLIVMPCRMQLASSALAVCTDVPMHRRTGRHTVVNNLFLSFNGRMPYSIIFVRLATRTRSRQFCIESSSATRSGHKRASPSDSQPADKMYVVDHIRYIFETANGQMVCIVRAMYGKGI